MEGPVEINKSSFGRSMGHRGERIPEGSGGSIGAAGDSDSRHERDGVAAQPRSALLLAVYPIVGATEVHDIAIT